MRRFLIAALLSLAGCTCDHKGLVTTCKQTSGWLELKERHLCKVTAQELKGSNVAYLDWDYMRYTIEVTIDATVAVQEGEITVSWHATDGGIASATATPGHPAQLSSHTKVAGMSEKHVGVSFKGRAKGLEGTLDITQR